MQPTQPVRPVPGPIKPPVPAPPIHGGPFRVMHYGGSSWGIFCGYYSDKVHAECKKTPGLHWTAQRKAWCGYKDAVEAAAYRMRSLGIRIDTHTLDDALTTVAHDRMRPILVPALATRDLRDYQSTGVEFIVMHSPEGVILADDVGLGKTVQAIRAARALNGKTIIVVPNFLKSVWVTAILGDKTLTPPTPVGWPGAKFEVLGKTKPWAIHPDTKIVIINYDVLHAWADTLIAWQPSTIIFDECHYLMGEKARRTRSAARIAAACANRIGLSATPMTSRPRDLWAPVNVISPGRFGENPWPYYKMHCNAFTETVQTKMQDRLVWNTKGSSNLDELQKRLSHFMLRRNKSDVSLQIPLKMRQIVEVDVDKRFVLAISVALQNDDSLRRALEMASDGKLGDVAQLVLNHVASGHSVVIGCWRKAVAEALADGIRGAGVKEVGVIHSEINAKKRKALIASKPKVTCITYGTSVGIDLSYADVGVGAELTHVPSDLLQWEGRFARFRQTRNVLVQYIIARGTADELIRDGVLKKLHVLEGSLGKSDNKLREDLAGVEKSPAEQLKTLYDRIRAKQSAQEESE